MGNKSVYMLVLAPLWSPEQPNYRLGISDTYETKMTALRCHKTQIFEGDLLQKLESLLIATVRGTKFKYAEAFVRIEMPQFL